MNVNEIVLQSVIELVREGKIFGMKRRRLFLQEFERSVETVQPPAEIVDQAEISQAVITAESVKTSMSHINDAVQITNVAVSATDNIEKGVFVDALNISNNDDENDENQPSKATNAPDEEASEKIIPGECALNILISQDVQASPTNSQIINDDVNLVHEPTLNSETSKTIDDFLAENIQPKIEIPEWLIKCLTDEEKDDWRKKIREADDSAIEKFIEPDGSINARATRDIKCGEFIVELRGKSLVWTWDMPIDPVLTNTPQYFPIIVPPNTIYYPHIDRSMGNGVDWSGSFIRAANREVANCEIMHIYGNHKDMLCFYATKNISAKERIVCFHDRMII